MEADGGALGGGGLNIGGDQGHMGVLVGKGAGQIDRHRGLANDAFHGDNSNFPRHCRILITDPCNTSRSSLKPHKCRGRRALPVEICSPIPLPGQRSSRQFLGPYSMRNNGGEKRKLHDSLNRQADVLRMLVQQFCGYI